MRVDFSPPDISEADIEAVADALRSGWITTGPRTKQLEQELAAWCSTPRVACLNSATAAMECALRLLEIGPGDEVITSAYTYTASASVICHVGATPVLVDTAPGSYEMDYEQLLSAITPRTKAVIPIDIGGVMCNYDWLLAGLESVADRYRPKAGTLQELFDRVVILADAAHSLGALYKGRPSGSVADFSSFSFHAVKNLTTAEGGALTWKSRAGVDDNSLYKHLMLLSLHGQDKDALSKSKASSWEYDVIAPLYKYNMTDVTAALGLSQLQRYPILLKKRRSLLEHYTQGLAHLNCALLQHYPASDASDLTSPGEGEALSASGASGASSASSGHLCMVRLLDTSEAFRNAFIEGMAARGVSCNVHYKPLPLLTAYRNLGFDIRNFPQALAQYRNQVTLPLHTNMTDADVAYVIESFEATYEECVSAGV